MIMGWRTKQQSSSRSGRAARSSDECWSSSSAPPTGRQWKPAGSCSDEFNDNDISKATRGHNRRIAAKAKMVKIHELSNLLGEALEWFVDVEPSPSSDNLIDRIICVLPGIRSAMQGQGGRIQKRAERFKRNLALHSPAQPHPISSLSASEASALQRSSSGIDLMTECGETKTVDVWSAGKGR